jgi:hypothetical protein
MLCGELGSTSAWQFSALVLVSLDPAAWNWIQSLSRISATIPSYVCVVGWWQLSGSQQHDPTSYQDVIEHNILYL